MKVSTSQLDFYFAAILKNKHKMELPEQNDFNIVYEIATQLGISIPDFMTPGLK